MDSRKGKGYAFCLISAKGEIMERRVTERISVTGRVQGVGFRPSVCRLAREKGLAGTVQNLGGEVEIFVTGRKDTIDSFVDGLRSIERPAMIETLERAEMPYRGFSAFLSIPSRERENHFLVPADMAVCHQCMKEMKSSADRRHHYPYISCTACGPRYTVIKKLPYDRENTSFDVYPFCEDCKSEYTEPADRRCHGETISCHACGPQLLGKLKGNPYEGPWRTDELLQSAKDLLSDGKIIMVKAVGGYNLVCRGDRDEAVKSLRLLKHRPDKPFAVLFGAMEDIEALCHVNDEERALLASPQRPIVVLETKKESREKISHGVTELDESLGVFLPPFGLYALLAEAGTPLVVTSCNYSGEPIIYHDGEAQRFYQANDSVAGIFYYEREIIRPVDDSVARIVGGKVQMLRRTRGYMPEPIAVEGKGESVLAVGGEMEPSFAITTGNLIYPGQVPAELSIEKSMEFFHHTADDWEELFRISPDRLICDRHPGYYSSESARRLAEKLDIPIMEVQHHHAHALSVMGEHHLKGTALAVIFDGTGFGEDGSIWGGEFLLCRDTRFKRIGYLKPITVIGGDKSMKQAWKSLLCHLLAAGISCQDMRMPVIKASIAGHVNTVRSSSMGRLFDAVCAFLGIADYDSYQGRCAMLLENEAEKARRSGKPGLPLFFGEEELDTGQGTVTVFDPAILWLGLKNRKDKDNSVAALGFHDAVIRMVARMAEKAGTDQIVLSGGCFANRILLEGCISELQGKGFAVYWNEQLPPGDGGLAFGQAWYGMHAEARK